MMVKMVPTQKARPLGLDVFSNLCAACGSGLLRFNNSDL